MVIPQPPFLNESEIAELHVFYGRGMATVQAFQDPEPVITFARWNTTTGTFDELSPVTLIRVGIDNRDEQLTGQNQGVVQSVVQGELKGWHPLDVQKDDRFIWDGQTMRVTVVYPERLGVIKADFVMHQSASGV